MLLKNNNNYNDKIINYKDVFEYLFYFILFYSICTYIYISTIYFILFYFILI